MSNSRFRDFSIMVGGVEVDFVTKAVTTYTQVEVGYFGAVRARQARNRAKRLRRARRGK